jgi:hypothetical protein
LTNFFMYINSIEIININRAHCKHFGNSRNRRFPVFYIFLWWLVAPKFEINIDCKHNKRARNQTWIIYHNNILNMHWFDSHAPSVRVTWSLSHGKHSDWPSCGWYSFKGHG